MPRKKQKNNQKKDKLILLIKINALILAWLMLVYLLIGILINPSFFQQDLKNKYAWAVGASSSVSLFIVNNPPDKPTVTANASCNETNSTINLSWATDVKTSSYDIYRDGLLLFSDYNTISYTDANVSDNTTYTYWVTAKNIIDATQSDSVSVQTPTCAVAPEPEPFEPVTQVQTIDGKKLTDFTCVVETERKRPTFTGTTNIPNASIYISVVRIKRVVDGKIVTMEYQTVITSTITPNDNGYWSWKVPDKLKKGKYILYITIINQNDASQVSETSLRFNAVLKCRSGSKNITCAGKTSKGEKERRREFKPGAPVTINNQGKLEPGENIKVNLPLEAQTGTGQREVRIENEKGEIVYQSLAPPGSKCDIELPSGLAAGVYKLILIIKNGDQCSTWETYLAIKDKPAVNFGGNMTITWNDILGALSAVAIALLGVLVFFLSMLFVEHLLAKKRLVWVDENSLKNKNLIS
jgi:hypothetical protein